MKAVQIAIEEDLVAAVDRVALREALARHRVKELEQKHRRGYQEHPAKSGEFDIWEGQQQWGDE